MTTAAMLLLGILLTAGTFVFVSAEFSLVAVDQAVLDSRAEEGDRGAASVLRATRSLSTQQHPAFRRPGGHHADDDPAGVHDAERPG